MDTPTPTDPRPTPPPARHGFFARLRELTRLVVGGVEVAGNVFFDRLQRWEAAAGEPVPGEPPAGGPGARALTGAELPPGGAGGALPELPPPAAYPDPPPEHLPLIRPGEEWRLEGLVVPDRRAGETARDVLRLALIGWLFEAEDRLEANTRRLGRLQSRLGVTAESFLRPFTHNRLTRPVRRRIERLAGRGEQELERWIARGRREESRGKRLAQAAYSQTIDEYIEYLARNPEVQELVQSQSEGLAGEVIEEVRERTVSADTFLEGFARRLLRLTPRGDLPEPPPEVRASAVTLRRIQPDE